MDSSGRIHQLDEETLAQLTPKQRAELVPIPDKELARVQTMSRKERRAWYAGQRQAARRAERAKAGGREPTP